MTADTVSGKRSPSPSRRVLMTISHGPPRNEWCGPADAADARPTNAGFANAAVAPIPRAAILKNLLWAIDFISAT